MLCVGSLVVYTYEHLVHAQYTEENRRAEGIVGGAVT
jgi:hypothetical protein